MSYTSLFSPEQSRQTSTRQLHLWNTSSLLKQVIIHVDPVASWEYFLVYNISEEWDWPKKGRPASMFYSSSPSLVVACFVLCLMFLLKTGVCLRKCLVAILVCLSAFPALSCNFSSSLYFDACVFVCVNGSVHVFVWVFHPWRDEKPRTICYAAVGHNRQHCCGFEQ